MTEIVRIYKRKIFRDSCILKSWKTQAIRITGRDMEQLFNDKKPILEHLTNVNVESWRADGLFKRGRIIIGKDIIEIPIGKKMRFSQMVISKWFEIPRGDPMEVCSSSGGVKMTKAEILADNHIRIRKMFAFAKYASVSAAVLEFITREKPVGARYYAKQNKIVWPQFVQYFNEVLEQVMIGCEYV